MAYLLTQPTLEHIATLLKTRPRFRMPSAKPHFRIPLKDVSVASTQVSSSKTSSSVSTTTPTTHTTSTGASTLAAPSGSPAESTSKSEVSKPAPQMEMTTDQTMPNLPTSPSTASVTSGNTTKKSSKTVYSPMDETFEDPNSGILLTASPTSDFVKNALGAIVNTTALPRHAAVLMPLCYDNSVPSILFIRRARTMRHHRGQIAFPGGMFEPDDLFDARTCALRETWEEIGLSPDHFTVLGAHHDASTSEIRSNQGTVVTPVVAMLNRDINDVRLSLQHAELDMAFCVPLELLCDGDRWDLFKARPSFGFQVGQECTVHRSRIIRADRRVRHKHDVLLAKEDMVKTMQAQKSTAVDTRRLQDELIGLSSNVCADPDNSDNSNPMVEGEFDYQHLDDVENWTKEDWLAWEEGRKFSRPKTHATGPSLALADAWGASGIPTTTPSPGTAFSPISKVDEVELPAVDPLQLGYDETRAILRQFHEAYMATFTGASEMATHALDSRAGSSPQTIAKQAQTPAVVVEDYAGTTPTPKGVERSSVLGSLREVFEANQLQPVELSTKVESTIPQASSHNTPSSSSSSRSSIGKNKFATRGNDNGRVSARYPTLREFLQKDVEELKGHTPFFLTSSGLSSNKALQERLNSFLRDSIGTPNGVTISEDKEKDTTINGGAGVNGTRLPSTLPDSPEEMIPNTVLVTEFCPTFTHAKLEQSSGAGGVASAKTSGKTISPEGFIAQDIKNANASVVLPDPSIPASPAPQILAATPAENLPGPEDAFRAPVQIWGLTAWILHTFLKQVIVEDEFRSARKESDTKHQDNGTKVKSNL